MKKLLLASAALGMFAAIPAHAAINLDVGINAGPGYYAPAPAYYEAPAPRPIYFRQEDRRRDPHLDYWRSHDAHPVHGDDHHDDHHR